MLSALEVEQKAVPRKKSGTGKVRSGNTGARLLGRRKTKTVSSVTTTYLYDGQNLIYEMSGSTPADYLFGPGIDEPLAMSRSAQVYYYSTDGLGSVGIVSDAAGVVKNKYSYDAWGVIKSQTVAVPQPFLYTAREASEASLFYYRARLHLPAIGRFVSEDPLRQKAGPNFYTYAFNSPADLTDPFGLITNLASGPESHRVDAAIAILRREIGRAILRQDDECNKCTDRFGKSVNDNFHGWSWVFSDQTPPYIVVVDRPRNTSSSANAYAQPGEPHLYLFIFRDYIRRNPIGCNLASTILHEVVHLARKDTRDTEDVDFHNDCRVGCLNPLENR